MLPQKIDPMPVKLQRLPTKEENFLDNASSSGYSYLLHMSLSFQGNMIKFDISLMGVKSCV
jgi:hypothetical protein